MPPHRTIVDQPSTLEPVPDKPSTSHQLESMEPQDHKSVAEAIALMTVERPGIIRSPALNRRLLIHLMVLTLKS